MILDTQTLKRISTVARELGVSDQAVRKAVINENAVSGHKYLLIVIDGLKFIRLK